MRPGTDILHPTNLACLGPLARKRRFHRTSWRLPPSTHDATFSHITTAHEAREAGETPSALTIYCITRVGVGANSVSLNLSQLLRSHGKPIAQENIWRPVAVGADKLCDSSGRNIFGVMGLL